MKFNSNLNLTLLSLILSLCQLLFVSYICSLKQWLSAWLSFFPLHSIAYHHATNCVQTISSVSYLCACHTRYQIRCCRRPKYPRYPRYPRYLAEPWIPTIAAKFKDLIFSRASLSSSRSTLSTSALPSVWTFKYQ